MKSTGRASLIARFAAELVGTFFLVVTIGFNLHTGSVGAALSMGSAVAAMVTALCPISGAHFNPAITLAVWLSGRGGIAIGEALCYMLFQILGGMLGTFTYWGIIGKELRRRPMFPYSLAEALPLEVVYTWALCYVFLNVMLGDSRAKESTLARPANGIAVGLTVTSAVVAIGPLSGCSLNPAVTFGTFSAARLLAGSGGLLGSSLSYAFAPFVGSLLGALSFFLVRGGCRGEYLADEDEWSPEAAALYGSRPCPSVPQEERAVRMHREDHGRPLTSRRIGLEPVALPSGMADHRLCCGLHWSVPRSPGGAVETFYSDLSCVKFGRAGECLGGVYFNEREDLSNGIHHSGDEVTGQAGLVDNEVIMLRLSDLKPNVYALFFTMTIYSSEQSFDDIEQCHLRIVDVTDNNKEFCRYERSAMLPGANGLIGAMLYRSGGRQWCFKAVDEMFSLPPNSSYRKLVPQMSEKVKQTSGGLFKHP